MTYEINETHNSNLSSWVESANDPNTGFPIQNLPFCVFRGPKNPDMPRVGVVIGDSVIDVWGLYGSGLISAETREAAVASSDPHLNRLARAQSAPVFEGRTGRHAGLAGHGAGGNGLTVCSAEPIAEK